MAEENKVAQLPTAAEFFDQMPEREAIVVAVAAPQGHGKTHLANTFPGPVIGDTENRAQIVMAKFEGQRLRKVTKDMETIRRTITMMSKVVCPDESQRNQFTYVLDSGSDWLQMAELEYLVEAKKDKVYPLVLWAKIYEKMDQVFDKIREQGFNMVITQQMAEIYRNEKPTGEFKAAGYKKIPYRVDVQLVLRKGIEYNGYLYYPETVVGEILKDCWHKMEHAKPYLVDVSYDGIFKEIKAYKHPGSRDIAITNILKELEAITKIPMDKAKVKI